MAKHFTQPGEVVIGGLARGDNTPRHARIIKENLAMLFIEPVLAATFAGKEFFYEEAFTLAETSDLRDYIFQTPNTNEWAHFKFHGSGSAITDISLWEDTQYSSTDAVTTYNNNRNSTDTADCLIYNLTATSTTDTGTRLRHKLSGSATQQSRDSMDVGYADELFLKQNAKYRISFATESTGNLCNMLIQWHEHTNLT
jgi:hypothetical protein